MRKENLEKLMNLQVRKDKYIEVLFETEENKIYIFNKKRYYDVTNDFKTVDTPILRLHKNYIEIFNNNSSEVTEKLVELKKVLKGEPKAEAEVKAEPKKTKKAKTEPKTGAKVEPKIEHTEVEKTKAKELGSRLEELMLEVLARETTETMKREMIPHLQKFIEETYGILPKKFEVKKDEEVRVVKGTPHEKFETVLKLVNADVPVFLTGPAGSGKNHLCKMVADALGLDFYFTNAVTSEYKLTGFIDANGTYHETEFYKAFKNGGLFMLDEMDASIPEVLIILNAGIANRYFDFPNGKIEAHKDFRVISAGNTVGTGADSQYVGRLQLDASSLDRFALVEIDYSRNVELAIARGNEELVNFIHDFRNGLKECGFDHLVSYRAVERITKLEGILEAEEIIEMCLLKHMSYDDRKILLNAMTKDSNKYYKVMNKLVA